MNRPWSQSGLCQQELSEYAQNFQHMAAQQQLIYLKAHHSFIQASFILEHIVIHQIFTRNLSAIFSSRLKNVFPLKEKFKFEYNQDILNIL